MDLPSLPTDRRGFIRQACCSAVGAVGALSTLAQLRVVGALAAGAAPARAAAAASDYKALVCLFLQGGNDGNSMIVPLDAANYARYRAARGFLSVDQAALLPIATKAYADGRSYGLHPALAPLRDLYAAGRVAALANVGTLVRPTTLAEYRAGRGLPPQLYSHLDQLVQWQSSVPDQAFKTGWGGRLADLLAAQNENQRLSMSISTAGTNRFQVGNQAAQLAVPATGPTRQAADGGSFAGQALRVRAQREMFAAADGNLLRAAYGGITASAIDNGDVLAAALATGPAPRTAFPGSVTGRQLQMIARLIAVAPALGLQRQVFFCQLGGWDLHAAQLAGHGPLLAELGAAMAAFHAATVELGVANQVTTFTASDFGRTYVPNADGTDHGWGNHQLIMGGAVKGGDIYGTMPSLVPEGPDDTGRGRWIPSTSVDEYNATLATWFGVSATNLPVVLPNIGRFPKPDLGFMG